MEDEHTMHVSINKLSNNEEDMFRMEAKKQRGSAKNINIRRYELQRN